MNKENINKIKRLTFGIEKNLRCEIDNNKPCRTCLNDSLKTLEEIRGLLK